jgi:hypothetical protein
MKKTLLLSFMAAAAATAAAAVGDVHVMDLRGGEFTYSEETGAWTEVNSEDAETVDVDIFSAAHNGFGSYFGGAFPSISTDTADYTEPTNTWTAHQWGNMAGGAVKVDADGNVEVDADGNVVAEPGAPYLINYWSSWYGPNSSTIWLSTDETMAAKEIYVAMHPWPYYGCLHGDGYARAFNQENDSFTVTFTALDSKMESTDKSVTFTLATSESDGQGGFTPNIPTTWQKVDLSSLGNIGGIHLTMDSSDTGDWGMNTAAYVCLDRFTVVATDQSSISEVAAKADTAAAVYYTLQGVRMPAGAQLPAGTYVKVLGGSSSKVQIR